MSSGDLRTIMESGAGGNDNDDNDDDSALPSTPSSVAIEVTRVLSLFTTLSASDERERELSPDAKHVTVGDAFEFELHVHSRFQSPVCGARFQVRMDASMREVGKKKKKKKDALWLRFASASQAKFAAAQQSEQDAIAMQAGTQERVMVHPGHNVVTM